MSGVVASWMGMKIQSRIAVFATWGIDDGCSQAGKACLASAVGSFVDHHGSDDGVCLGLLDNVVA